MAQGWHEFFATLAQVSVTAFSIMFLAMQFRHEAWRKGRLLAIEAHSALLELFVPMLIALISLMNGSPWRWAAALTGLFGLGMVVTHWTVYRFCPLREGEDPATEAEDIFHRRQVWLNLVSFSLYGTIFFSSFNPGGDGINLIAIVCTWLLFSGSFEAWWLLAPKHLPKAEH
jgi:hypothetical protein